jgi:hypothetical protein
MSGLPSKLKATKGNRYVAPNRMFAADFAGSAQLFAGFAVA